MGGKNSAARKRNMVYSEFFCTLCGFHYGLPRKLSRQRESGHIKDLWCPACHTVNKFVEVKPKEYAKDIIGQLPVGQGATYVMSDIHGCFDEFMEMLEQIHLQKTDKLIIAGDYIDRGPKTFEMLNWICECPGNVILLRGNHDEEFAMNVDYMEAFDLKENLGTVQDSNEDLRILYDTIQYALKNKDDGFDYYRTIRRLIEDSNVTFKDLKRWRDRIRQMPYYYETNVNERRCIVVHAGYTEQLDRIRDRYQDLETFYLYARNDAYTLGGIEHGMIVAGHTPTMIEGQLVYNEGRVFRYYDPEKDCIFYDIDCGCVFRKKYDQGRLGCMRLEDEKALYY